VWNSPRLQIHGYLRARGFRRSVTMAWAQNQGYPVSGCSYNEWQLQWMEPWRKIKTQILNSNPSLQPKHIQSIFQGNSANSSIQQIQSHPPVPDPRHLGCVPVVRSCWSKTPRRTAAKQETQAIIRNWETRKAPEDLVECGLAEAVVVHESP
jgi:hypothetical protein